MGGNFLLKLNIESRPIANKYREGKMKRTLERELKVPEIAKREANETSVFLRACLRLRRMLYCRPQGCGGVWSRKPEMLLALRCARMLGAGTISWDVRLFAAVFAELSLRFLPRHRNAFHFHFGIIVAKHCSSSELVLC
jgi:hypothetical protein